jgi:hypothetical protein
VILGGGGGYGQREEPRLAGDTSGCCDRAVASRLTLKCGLVAVKRLASRVARVLH